MKDFDLRKYLAEGKLLKEDLIDKIKKLKDYNKTEDSLKYKKYDITYDKDENLYSVFLKKGSGDSSDMPEFESSSPEKVKKYLAEGRLLKEEIMVDTTVMVDPNNTLMSNASDEEIDYIKANITNVPKMPVEDFIDIYDEYLDRFYDEADPLDLQIKALQIHIDKGALTREEAIEALAMLQGQDVEEFEDEFLAYEAKNNIKEGVDIDQMKIAIDEIASYLEDINKEEEVMSNVLDRHNSDPFLNMGEVYTYLDGLLQKY